MKNQSTRNGFTIVELLIVVVVIAILATITVVAYNGISQKAKESSLRSDLRHGATQLEVSKTLNSAYPNDATSLMSSKDTQFAYQPSGTGFCLSATSLTTPTLAFFVTNGGVIASGACPAAIPGQQVAQLLAGDGVADDILGASVALSGSTVIVGASGDDSCRGAAYVYTRSGSTWSQQAKLTASDRAAYDYFGDSVALSDNTAIIGAYASSGSSRGAAYAFTRSGSTWSQQAKLTANDGTDWAYFGNSVAVSGDTALVAARADDDARGAAYTFTRSGSTWSQQAKLIGNDSIGLSVFGAQVALSGDTAIIGSWGIGSSRGAAYIFGP